MALFIVAGVAHLAVGLAALIARQPYAIWYPFLLFGVICTVVMGPLYPVVRRRYEDAEQRRIDAEALRSS
jgi:membrane protein implicated in regulation of membrane protease activity